MLTFTQPLPLKGACLLPCAPEQEAVLRVLLSFCYLQICYRKVLARFDIEGRHMATIRQLLDKKGNEVFSVRPDETVYDSIKKMADKNVGSLTVMEADKLVGIITERHYARNVVLKGRASPKNSRPRYYGNKRRFCAT